jgi:hypothetical protein
MCRDDYIVYFYKLYFFSVHKVPLASLCLPPKYSFTIRKLRFLAASRALQLALSEQTLDQKVTSPDFIDRLYLVKVNIERSKNISTCCKFNDIAMIESQLG